MDKFKSIGGGNFRLRRASRFQPGHGQARILSEIRLPDNTSGIYAARYTPDGKMIVVTCGSGAIQQDQNKTDGQVAAESHRKTSRDSDSDSDSDDDTIIAMPTKSPAVINKMMPPPKEDKVSEKIMKFRHKSSGVFYAGSACGRIFKGNLKEGLCESFAKEEGNEVHAVDLDLTSVILATGGKDATVRLYDTQTSKIWDIRTPKGVIYNLYGPHICGGDAIDIQGDYLLTGSWSVKDSIKVWDIRTRSILDHVSPENRQPKLDGEFMYAVHFFNGDPSLDLILAGGSGTGAMEIISRKQNKIQEDEIEKMDEEMGCTGFNLDKKEGVFGRSEKMDE
ncbi:uncharacterized protein [Hetaerina americana]|uniref:uncharacterized protein n=1 Tax=Hetaerina americana TaxID=62018 RepID=UPI003A7F4F4B